MYILQQVRNKLCYGQLKKSNFGAVYEIDLDVSILNIKQFLSYSNEFIDTFCLCRAGLEEKVEVIKGYDTVNNVYLFLNLYFKYCKEADKKVLTSAFNNIISKVPKYRLEELKLTLSDL